MPATVHGHVVLQQLLFCEQRHKSLNFNCIIILVYLKQIKKLKEEKLRRLMITVTAKKLTVEDLETKVNIVLTEQYFLMVLGAQGGDQGVQKWDQRVEC